jgi:RNA polymerase sigma factor (sigma-70 family)
MDADVIEWLSCHFLPFEAELRLMLRRVCASPAEIDDVIQDTYCKVLALDSVHHVREPRAYLVRTAKNIVTDRLRHDAVVHFEAISNLDELVLTDDTPSPERVVHARAELAWVMGLIGKLPERCRKVFQARRLHGLSQNETASTLGITEGLVEYETARAMDLISGMIAEAGLDTGPHATRPRKAKRAAKNDHAKH